MIWLVVSALFAVYVAYFSSYDKTYGSLAGVVVFLVWLWLTNIAILLGAKVSAESTKSWHRGGRAQGPRALRGAARQRAMDESQARGRRGVRAQVGLIIPALQCGPREATRLS